MRLINQRLSRIQLRKQDFRVYFDPVGRDVLLEENNLMQLSCLIERTQAEAMAIVLQLADYLGDKVAGVGLDQLHQLFVTHRLSPLFGHSEILRIQKTGQAALSEKGVEKMYRKKRGKKSRKKLREKTRTICLHHNRCGIGSAGGEIEATLLPFWKGPTVFPETSILSALNTYWFGC